MLIFTAATEKFMKEFKPDIFLKQINFSLYQIRKKVLNVREAGKN